MIGVHEVNDILNEDAKPADVLEDVDLADQVEHGVARDRLVKLHLVFVVLRLFHYVLQSNGMRRGKIWEIYGEFMKSMANLFEIYAKFMGKLWQINRKLRKNKSKINEK